MSYQLVLVTEDGCWSSETCFVNLKLCVFIPKLLRVSCYFFKVVSPSGILFLDGWISFLSKENCALSCPRTVQIIFATWFTFALELCSYFFFFSLLDRLLVSKKKSNISRQQNIKHDWSNRKYNKICANYSTNQMQIQNQSRHGHVRFPALGTGCVCLFNFAAIGHSDSFVSN